MQETFKKLEFTDDFMFWASMKNHFQCFFIDARAF